MAMRIWKWGAGVVVACGVLLGGVAAAMAAAEVTDVTAAPRYPWNGLVDIRCTVTGMAEGGGGGEFEVAAVDGETGTEREVSHVRVVKGGAETDDLTVTANGSYELVWDARADLGEGEWDGMVVRVTIADDAPRGGQLWAGGPYWADRNIGADNPWDYGLYFWWGDTTGHRPSGSTFSFNFYYDNSAISTYGKDYDTLQSEGWITAAGVLAPQHDAAHVHWGGAWRMPTDQEFGDLCSKCDWTWTTMNGVKGYLVRGRGTYAGNSIFLPADGHGYGTSLFYSGSDGGYWSSTPRSSYSNYAWDLYFYSDIYSDIFIFSRGNGSYRFYGQSVRALRGFAE